MSSSLVHALQSPVRLSGISRQRAKCTESHLYELSLSPSRAAIAQMIACTTLVATTSIPICVRIDEFK